jgi:hypothetical protein
MINGLALSQLVPSHQHLFRFPQLIRQWWASGPRPAGVGSAEGHHGALLKKINFADEDVSHPRIAPSRIISVNQTDTQTAIALKNQRQLRCVLEDSSCKWPSPVFIFV